MLKPDIVEYIFIVTAYIYIYEQHLFGRMFCLGVWMLSSWGGTEKPNTETNLFHPLFKQNTSLLLLMDHQQTIAFPVSQFQPFRITVAAVATLPNSGNINIP